MAYEIKYLSPSSYKDWKRCSHRFKLVRLEGNRVEFKRTINMDVGTVFDAVVKSWLNRRLSLDVLLKEVTNQEAIQIGSNLAQIYRMSGALQALIDEGVGQVEIDKETIINGVPIYGKPDMTMKDGTVNDWKTSLNGSPKPGYSTRREWILGGPNGGWLDLPQPQAHEKADCFLEEIDHDWALQTTQYALLMGHRVRDPLKCRIEHIVVQAKKVVIAGYHNAISPDFQQMIYDEPKEIWDTIKSGEIPQPSYSKHRCFAFGKECEVSHLCKAFQDAKSDNFEEGNLLGKMDEMLGGMT